MADPTCSVDGCERPFLARNLCNMHYKRLRRHGDPGPRQPVERRTGCDVEGCDRPHASQGLCKMHDHRRRRTGDPGPAESRGFGNNCSEDEAGRPVRTCTKCGVTKLRDEFSPKKLSQDGRQSWCIECSNASYRQWRADNPEARREAQARRRARMRGAAELRFTPGELTARLSMFGFRCWMCGGPFEHIDHVKPLVAGGKHCLSNLRPACGTCNRSKNGQWPYPLQRPASSATRSTTVSEDQFRHTLEDGREIVLPHFKHIPFGVIRRLRKEDDAEQMFALIEEVAEPGTLDVIDELGMVEIEALFSAWQEASKVTVGESSASQGS